MEKKKLTLSVNSEVVEKAKSLGLNLSEITENALKMTTLVKEDNKDTNERLVLAYQEVFESVSPILKKWGVAIMIGEYMDYLDKERKCLDQFYYTLSSDEIDLWCAAINEEPLKSWKITDRNMPTHHFFDPDRIIKELIDKLYDTEKKNEIKIEKLVLISNILRLSGLTDKEVEND